MHIGYTFRKESWPKGTEVLIEKTNFTEAVMEYCAILNMNFIKCPESDIEEKYIIEKAYS